MPITFPRVKVDPRPDALGAATLRADGDTDAIATVYLPEMATVLAAGPELLDALEGLMDAIAPDAYASERLKAEPYLKPAIAAAVAAIKAARWGR